jgi:putative ABC transport system permease protein
MDRVTQDGPVALLHCAIGIYGVVAYEVGLRTREIAIRMAIGAQPSSVLRMVLGEAAVVTAAGALLGLGGSFLLRRSIESQLYQVRTSDPIVLSAVAGMLLLVAIIACALPARRAMATNPSVALAGR